MSVDMTTVANMAMDTALWCDNFTFYSNWKCIFFQWLTHSLLADRKGLHTLVVASSSRSLSHRVIPNHHH